MRGRAAGVLARDAGYDKLTGTVAEAAAPLEIELPPELLSGLEKAWEKSFPGEESQEQIGILVKDKDGKYVWRAGKPGSSGQSKPNYEDVKAGETIVATGHTHPYSKEEGGHVGVPESAGDLTSLIMSKEPMDTVYAGTKQFVVARTAEFDKRIAGLDLDGKKKLRDEMRKLWQDTFDATRGALPVKSEAAVKAVCEKYQLVFYAGTGGKLKRQTKIVVKPAPGTKKQELEKAVGGGGGKKR